ncbi:MAG: hypothetical protein M8357_12855 [Desulfobulbaceae bacterium]|nr:hypothetical protein [Desulfobulbaceae bacterium]
MPQEEVFARGIGIGIAKAGDEIVTITWSSRSPWIDNAGRTNDFNS